MSISTIILDYLLQQSLYNKGIPTIIFDIPDLKNNSKKTISQTVYRLSQKGYILKNKDGYTITLTGKKYSIQLHNSLAQFAKPVDLPKEKTLLVFFDIPESKRDQRQWFREHLKRFDYSMIQRSVWVGPNPLPKDFLAYIQDIGLMDCIQTLQLAKPYVPPDTNKKKGVRSYLDKIKNMI